MLQHLGQLLLISLIASGGVRRALRGLGRLTFRPGSVFRPRTVFRFCPVFRRGLALALPSRNRLRSRGRSSGSSSGAAYAASA